MQVQTREWGDLAVDRRELVHLPDGLLGFEELHNYIFVEVEEYRPFVWFLSTEDPDVGFAVADPQHFHPTPFPMKLSEADEAMLDLEAGDSLAIFVIVSPGADGEITANLKGPIVLNTRNRLAKQVVTFGTALSVRQPLLNHGIAPPGHQVGSAGRAR